jgi:hypothetical protein
VRAGTHSAGKETEAPLEATANAEGHTATREHQLSRSREIRAPLAATPIRGVKATRALVVSVITTTADRREVTRQEGGPASVVEVFTLAVVVSTVAVVVFTPVVAAIASGS